MKNEWTEIITTLDYFDFAFFVTYTPLWAVRSVLAGKQRGFYHESKA